MASKKIIAICQSGGEFMTNEDDGSLEYVGGEAYALDLDEGTHLEDVKQELSETFQCGVSGMTIKYFLPGNKKTLITLSKDKDLKRMVNFFKDSNQVEIFIIVQHACQSSRTTASESLVPPVTPLDIVYTDDHLVLGQVIDTSPLATFPSSSNVKHHKAATQWENNITGVNQRFSCFTEFREALHKYSIAHGFTYKYKKNDSHRVTVKCKSEGCPWRIYASRLATTQLICIKKMNGQHNCEGATAKAGYRATRGWVGNIIKEKLKVSPNYKPKDIANDIKREYGIQMNYSQAWRAKEIAREQLQGSYKEAYNQLPLFCQKIVETNPGSLATFFTKEDFRAFIYQGTLLAAIAADGNDDAFPVAFAVVDEETDDNWHWFLQELKSAVSTSRQITFISDFQKGIRQSLIDIFGKDCYHGYCLQYLAEKLNEDLRGQFSHEARRLMVQDLYAASFALKLEDFNRCSENIKAISPEAYNWVIQSEPEHWANAFFKGSRYNHMTSSFGQLFYDWVQEVSELPITQMVDVLRGKMMELMYTRRVESSEWVSKLTPMMENKLQNETLKAQSLQVLLSHGGTFEVRGESLETVNIDRWDCSCKEWHLNGLPCSHAIAVFQWLGRSSHDYCLECFTTESYRMTYAESIDPIPDVENLETGRPKTKHGEIVDIIKRQLQCSKCKGLGHNKKTCERHNRIEIEAADPLLLPDLHTEEPQECST
ncbi:hypothetical protein LIER_08391 [Lithospermum erythrorhizon]|uniref:SWIM-type domain-containing protein n=1 Tax=Lithospermum erythrorhizon TaxID=34254 RepID=A0AAV3PBQ5_LITER